MKIHEYQAKELLSRYGIPVDKGFLCTNMDEALKVYSQLPTKSAIIKAQVLTGGRGKAGGVKIVHSEEAYKQRVNDILNMDI
ncbi:MAG TPA: succinate--CoA ligase subunit beta, partial [Bacteroides reticulotermitis]|nr:succinate--CoA ligase subunit beta [Bacteroides reticulotermitis]